MSNNIKVKSYTIEQDGVEMELVVGKEYEFPYGGGWYTAELIGVTPSNNVLLTTRGDFGVVREIKAPEMRPTTQLEAIEHLSVLSRTEVVMARFLEEHWCYWSGCGYHITADLEYCILCEGKLGEPKRLEIEV